MAKKSSLDYFRSALNEITSGNLKPVYVLCGEETFFTDRLLTRFKEMLPEGERDFNFDLIYGRETTTERVLDIARSYPMMAERRIILVKDFMQLAARTIAPDTTGKKGDSLNILIPYLEQPNPATLLVLIDSQTPNGRTKLGRALKNGENVRYYQFDEVKEFNLPEWITEWTKFRHNKKLAPGVAEKLAQSAGNSLMILASEIDKVCTFINGKEIIESDDVKNIVGSYKEYSVFDLKDAIIVHDTEKALYIGSRMLEMSNNPSGEIIKTVAFLYSMFSKIWQIRWLAAKKMGKKAIQKEIGIGNTWFFNQLWQQAQAFSLMHIHNAFETLLDTDRAVKGFSKMDERGIFFLMIDRISRID